MNQAIEIRSCLKCGTEHPSSHLVDHEYRCPHCDLETAHLDRAPNGVIRGIYSWLRQVDEVIHDRYKVKALLGRGGFAATYLVDDLRLDGKTRALKEIPELLFDTYETTLLSRLDHPSIPDITDQFTEESLTYLVLKFGGNKTLESERKKSGGQIPLANLVPWMQQLCDVLDYLHSQNPAVIHRDLKPANILLDDNDRVTLIDFGIAKEADDGQETRTLARAVTHGFSPPEQVGGTGTDPRSDIYALGATFYAVATGIVPPASHERLSGKSIVEPSQLISNFPPALNQAILSALDLNINNRQQSIKEFSESFSSSTELPPVAQPSGTMLVSDSEKLSLTASTLASTPVHSVKLPTNKPADQVIPSEPTKYKTPLPLLIIPLILVSALAAAGVWIWQNQNETENAVDVIAIQTDPTESSMDQATLLEDKNAVAEQINTEQTGPSDSDSITPADTALTPGVSPIATTAPPATSGSTALSEFNKHRTDSVSPPASTSKAADSLSTTKKPARSPSRSTASNSRPTSTSRPATRRTYTAPSRSSVYGSSNRSGSYGSSPRPGSSTSISSWSSSTSRSSTSGSRSSTQRPRSIRRPPNMPSRIRDFNSRFRP